MSTRDDIHKLKDKLGWSENCGSESPALTSLLIGNYYEPGLFDILLKQQKQIDYLENQIEMLSQIIGWQRNTN